MSVDHRIPLRWNIQNIFPIFMSNSMNYNMYVRIRAKDNKSAISDAIKRNRKRVQNKASFNKIYRTPSHDKIKNRKCENHAMLNYLIHLNMIR